jgi:hypothetical protein
VLLSTSESLLPVPAEISPGFSSVLIVQLKSVTGGEGGVVGMGSEGVVLLEV